MKRTALITTTVIASLAGPVQADDYDAMLHYLTSTSISQHALSGASGVVGINMAAGDFNLQSNDRVIVGGARGTGSVEGRQSIQGVMATEPDIASARIEGDALAGVRGVVSINQASGVANIERNTMTITPQQIQPGEADLPALQADSNTSSRARSTGTSRSLRAVAVEDTALRGLEGVVQLNQIAGSGNVTGNHLIMSVTPALR